LDRKEGIIQEKHITGLGNMSNLDPRILHDFARQGKLARRFHILEEGVLTFPQHILA
jgi:hypothetical protein